MVPYSEASYKAIISLDWSSPKFTVPAGVHVTPIIGMIHSKDTSLWIPGKIASPGLEDVAEVGNNIKMNAELDAILLKNKALSKFAIPAPGVTSSVETNFTFNTNYSYISFASMIAPSPDWFMGIHDVTLFDGKIWLNDVTLNIMVYDAGTEEGDVFGYNNPGTNPRLNIGLLTPSNASVLANGNTVIAAIGTIRFVKN
ncbi:MAG TPA: spondin domain-containing protein [Chitinophagaceae bacterium]|nr:spondin domain-containing protein [Chitinophagaceae bacterium]